MKSVAQKIHASSVLVVNSFKTGIVSQGAVQASSPQVQIVKPAKKDVLTVRKPAHVWYANLDSSPIMDFATIIVHKAQLETMI